MALNIPNVGFSGDALMKGLDTGSTLFSRYVNPILQREQLAEQGKYHQGSLAQQQAEMQQRQQQFIQELALRKQAEARMAQNAGLQQELAKLQMQKLKNSLDPMYEFNQFQALQNMITGGGKSNSISPSQEIGQGMGAFSPESLQKIQNEAPQNNENPNGIDLNLLKQNPLLRGYFKQKFGYDPLSLPQTPEEKNAMAVDLFKQKEAIKSQNKGGLTPTNNILTQNQQAIQAIDTVVPMIDEFINDPNKVYGVTDFSRGKKAAYEAKTGGMIDTLISAQSLPKVQASIDLVEQQIRRHAGESVKDYIARLKDLKKDLYNRRLKSVNLLEKRQVNTASPEDFSSFSDEELNRIASGGQ